MNTIMIHPLLQLLVNHFNTNKMIKVRIEQVQDRIEKENRIKREKYSKVIFSNGRMKVVL